MSRHVFVVGEGLGLGVVVGFKKGRVAGVGASRHTINFENGGTKKVIVVVVVVVDDDVVVAVVGDAVIVVVIVHTAVFFVRL